MKCRQEGVEKIKDITSVAENNISQIKKRVELSMYLFLCVPLTSIRHTECRVHSLQTKWNSALTRNRIDRYEL